MDWVEFIRSGLLRQAYEISQHADDERLADGLTVDEVEGALMRSEILEEYPQDPRGYSCLALGFLADGRAVHVVCGGTRQERLIWITVYLPGLPKWLDARTRNRSRGE